MRDRNAPLIPADIEFLGWEKMGGLIPAVVQDVRTLAVLMLAYMSREFLAATLAGGEAVFHSRSRGRLWRKGETSGHVLAVSGVFADCDGDALLVLATPAGSTCHLGTPSCFDERPARGVGWLARLAALVAGRAAADPGESYTRRLLDAGLPRIAQKVGEEAVELALAAVTRDRDGCVAETADLLYHLAVLMHARAFGWDEVAAELERRHETAPSSPSPLAGRGVSEADG